MNGITDIDYHFPLFVYPTRRCNYECSYCYTESDPLRSSTSFVLSHWESLMEQAHHLGVPEIRISGGEPLLIPTLDQLCEVVTRLRMRYTVTTNGSLLRRHLAWMENNPPDTLWISFHPEYASPDQFVAQVTKAAAKLPLVGINMFDIDVVAHSQLPFLAAAVGVRRIKIVHRTPLGRNARQGHAPAWPEIQLVAANLLSRFAFELRVELPSLPGTMRGQSTCVLAIRPLLSIDHDGCIYPCCATVGSRADSVGDLTSETLREVARRATPHRLPCSNTLPAIARGAAACPLSLVKMS